jgi:signal transduction histidine kinase
LRLSVATKIFLGFAAVIIAFGATSAFTLYRMSALRRSVTVLWKELNPMSNQLRALSRQLKSAEEFLALKRPNDAQWLQQVLPALEPFEGPQGFSRLSERLSLLAASDDVSDVDRPELAALADAFRRFSQGHELTEVIGGEELVEVSKRGEVVSNAELYDRLVRRTLKVASLGELQASSPETRAATRVIRRVNREVNDAVRGLAGPIRVIDQRTESDERQTTLAAGLIAAGALGVSIVILFVAQLTLRPIRKLREGARKIAAGDYAERVKVQSSDEIGQLAEEFNRMAASLEERDKALADKQEELVQAERLAAVGRLAAQITHEVRNPLSSIGLNTELLEDELEALPEPAAARAMLQAISAEVHRLKGITEQYLQLTRFSQARAAQRSGDDGSAAEAEPTERPESLLAMTPLERGPCDVSDLVRRFAAFLGPEAAEAGVTVTVDATAHAPLLADAGQLRQALHNLARNAIEALRSQSGERQLTLATRDREGGGVILSVEDNGPGVPAPLKDRLFTPFTTGKAHGTGLGLALTRDIVHAHGGTIAIRTPTHEGRGTAVDIALPPGA